VDIDDRPYEAAFAELGRTFPHSLGDGGAKYFYLILTLTPIGDEVTLDFAKHEALQAYDKIIVDPEESHAANTLWINDHFLVPRGFPKTWIKLEALGLPIIELDVSEMRKMDGGLTCLSIRF